MIDALILTAVTACAMTWMMPLVAGRWQMHDAPVGRSSPAVLGRSGYVSPLPPVTPFAFLAFLAFLPLPRRRMRFSRVWSHGFMASDKLPVALRGA